MIITCPNCQTRYTVNASAFTATGRKVRCSQCGHEWHEAAPADAPLSVAPAIAGAGGAAAAPQRETSPQWQDEGRDDADAHAHAHAHVHADAAPAAAAAAAAAGRRGSPSHPEAVPGRPSERRLATVAGWLALIAFVLGSCAALAAFREEVVRIWPATAALYRAVGLPVAVKGVEFSRVIYQRTVENGLTVLSISGEIVNTADGRKPVPRVRVSLRDADGAELYHYFFAASAETLDAGEAVPFVSRLSSPPAAARDLVLRFVEPGELPGPAVPAPGGGNGG